MEISNPTLSRVTHTRFLRNLFGIRNSNFRKLLAEFIIETADKTEEIFRSRFKSGLELVTPSINEDASIIWASAAFSLAQYYGGLTFEEISNLTNIEIAGNAFVLNPDIRRPVDQRIALYTNQLCSGNNSVRIAAFCRVCFAIESLTECLDNTHVTKEQIYELSWLLKEFKRFSDWSIQAKMWWTDCGDIVNSWYSQGLVPYDLPRPSMHFALDMDTRLSNLKQVFEC